MKITVKQYLKDLSDKRADRLKLWINTNYDGVEARFIEKFNFAQSDINQTLNKSRTFGEAKARKIELSSDIALGWLDEDDEPIAQTNAVYQNTINIPVMNVNGSMGHGAQAPENEIAIAHLQVTRNWLRENLSAVSSPNNISMITGLGDSMEPTYKHGDTIFVDTGITNIDLDAVYVMVLNNELYIKRIQRRPDGIWVISDNKSRYESYLIKRSDLDQVRVVGRVCGTMNFNRI